MYNLGSEGASSQLLFVFRSRTGAINSAVAFPEALGPASFFFLCSPFCAIRLGVAPVNGRPLSFLRPLWSPAWLMTGRKRTASLPFQSFRGEIVHFSKSISIFATRQAQRVYILLQARTLNCDELCHTLNKKNIHLRGLYCLPFFIFSFSSPLRSLSLACQRSRLQRDVNLSSRDILIQISAPWTLSLHSCRVKAVTLTLFSVASWIEGGLHLFKTQTLYPIQRATDFKGGHLSSCRFMLSLRDIYITLSCSSLRRCKRLMRHGSEKKNDLKML